MPWAKKLSVGVAALALLAGAVWLLRGAQRLPTTPPDVAWDRASCAHCRMLVGEPKSSAQLVTRSGTIHVFDDPGCLFTFVAEKRPAVHRTWLHHAHADRWLTPAEAGFVPGATPMGFGLVVVDKGTPGALPYADAERQVLAQKVASP
jgi:copper chaperone NosL